jgi:hypothetical protein
MARQKRLTALPPDLHAGTVPQLRSLDLRCNHLVSLPHGLCTLSRLEELDLYHNQLTSPLFTARRPQSRQPETLGNLGNPELIECRCFGRLKSLRRLNLGANGLEALPAGIGGLEVLEELVLANNRLKSLPEEIGGLVSLQVLKCEENRLTSLPRRIEELKSLVTLDLSYNRLKSLPEQLWGLGGLNSDEGSGHGKGLKDVELYGNELRGKMARLTGGELIAHFGRIYRMKRALLRVGETLQTAAGKRKGREAGEREGCFRSILHILQHEVLEAVWGSDYVCMAGNAYTTSREMSQEGTSSNPSSWMPHLNTNRIAHGFPQLTDLL